MTFEQENYNKNTVVDAENDDDDTCLNTHAHVGRVTTFHSRKGFGFIERLSDGQVFFVHHTAIASHTAPLYKSWNRTLYTGEYVEFLIAANDHSPGKQCAKHVTGISGGKLMMDSAAWKIIKYKTPKGVCE